MVLKPGELSGYDPKEPTGAEDPIKGVYPHSMEQVPVDNDHGTGVEVNLKDKMAQAVIKQRNTFRQLFIARYRELLLNIRDFVNVPVSVDKYVVEWYLRNGYQVAIGKNSQGVTVALGYVNDSFSVTNASTPYGRKRLTGADISYIIPDHQIPTSKIKEITHLDNAATGDFVIVRNKPVTYLSDYRLIDFYADRLAELMASRFSLIIQSKTTSVFPVDSGDTETADKLINTMYNGSPYLMVNDQFDIKDAMVLMGDAGVAERIKTLKQAFNDEQNELNNLLGINSTGIDKASGVSNEEVSSNDDYVLSTTNMYVRGVQQGFDLYNQRFNTDYQCFMNQPSAKRIQFNQPGDGGEE